MRPESIHCEFDLVRGLISIDSRSYENNCFVIGLENAG